ncbi:MAG: F0F1 ATP synthase subunit B [Bacteroidales bacterium]|nr:F0F1 ATP synthase subunit B [Bacteroidales bacterium]
MSVFYPDFGLIFWMLLVFLLVVMILGKYLWPFFIKAVEQRSKFIEKGVEDAKEAAKALANANALSKKIIDEAYSKQISIINETDAIKAKLIEQAKIAAKKESLAIMQQTNEAIENAKKEAFEDIKIKIVDLTLNLAEKVMRNDLKNTKNQKELIEKIMNEITIKN